MSATVKGDLLFEKQVAQDHIQAYTDKNLVFGAFADKNTTLRDDAKAGETITMPFYKKIGPAEKPSETAVLTVDKLQDDKFTATVAEIGKAVGFKDAALIKSGDSEQGVLDEASRQIGVVHAEAIDADLKSEILTTGNNVIGFQAAAATDVCTAQNLLKGKINAFGDKQGQAKVLFLHSQHVLSFGVELFNKMLVKDANDPYAQVPGFAGRILEMVVIVTDELPEGTPVAGKKVYPAIMIKDNAYGFIVKKDMQIETDRDILARENVIAATQWYAVKSYHAKVAANDKRIAVLNFATELGAV